MKTTGIIVEYNPLHPGHIYHMEQARKQTGADYLIAVMSGSFVQRGAPALLDKYTRTRMALLAGADVVIELPVCFATGSAGDFAAGAVSLLDKLGCVDGLCFGSESGDISLFEKNGNSAAVRICCFFQCFEKSIKIRAIFPCRTPAGAAFMPRYGKRYAINSLPRQQFHSRTDCCPAFFPQQPSGIGIHLGAAAAKQLHPPVHDLARWQRLSRSARRCSRLSLCIRAAQSARQTREAGSFVAAAVLSRTAAPAAALGGSFIAEHVFILQ